MDNNNLFDDLDFFNSSAQDLFATKTPTEQANKPTTKESTNPSRKVEDSVVKNTSVQTGQNVAVQIEKEQSVKKQQVAQNKQQTTEQNDASPQKAKGKKSKKKKRLIANLVIFILLLGGGGAFGILYYQDISQKLETPTFTYYQVHTGTIIEASLNQRADKYEFVITQPGKEDVSIVAKSNLLELGSYLNQPGQYGIKVRCLGKVEKAHSDYSQSQIITYKAMLEAPTIYKNPDDTISWDAIANAHGYRVYYKVDPTTNEMQYVEMTPLGNLDVVKFYLVDIYEIGQGVYPITVVAVGRSGGVYLDSAPSNTVMVNYSKQMQVPQDATYYNDTKTLKIAIDTSARIPKQFKVEVTYDNQERTKALHYVVTDDVNYKDEFVNGVSCRVYSASFSEFAIDNVLSMKITALAPDVYSTDSLATNVVVH